MNSFLGVLAGFLGWAFMGYVFSWLLLKVYDSSRFPMDDVSETDEKINSHLRIKYAVIAGFIVGMFWVLAIHHNPLISN
jgi:hypothetical protein